MRNELYCGDCLDILPNLDLLSEFRDLKADIILTDPPYGMNFQSNWSKSGPRHKKIRGDDGVDPRFLNPVVNMLTEDGGALMLFCDWNTSHRWRQEIEKRGLKIVSQVIWDREHHGMGDLKGAFAPMHDILWYATKGRRIFENGRPKSVFRYRRPSPSEDHGHPTCKPIQLIMDLLRAVMRERNRLVVDPFLGSGTTGVACAKLNLNFIGIELEKEYFKIAKQRIEKGE